MTHELGLGRDGSGLFSSLGAPTYYQLLNVDPLATRLMIRESYLRVKSLFQGSNDGLYGVGDAGDIQRQAAEIEEAFSVLNDDAKRARYDQSIGLSPKAPAATSGHSYLSNYDGGYDTQSDLIHTNRSTLKVIKTRAQRCGEAEMQDGFKAIMAEADLGDGSILQKLRQLAGVGEIEIQERTKISLEYIRAMENNRFEKLPQVVYVKGFIRSYLKYLCIPESEKIITAFAARLEAWQHGAKQ
jgi:DnaJ-class molecular chaperone